MHELVVIYGYANIMVLCNFQTQSCKLFYVVLRKQYYVFGEISKFDRNHMIQCQIDKFQY